MYVGMFCYVVTSSFFRQRTIATQKQFFFWGGGVGALPVPFVY